MYIALRESNCNTRIVQSLIDDFLATLYEFNSFRNQHVLFHGYIHGTVTHVFQNDDNAPLRIYDVTPVLVFGIHFLHRLLWCFRCWKMKSF